MRVLTRRPRHRGALDAAEFELPAQPQQAIEVLIPDRAFVKQAVGNRWGPLAAMVTPGHELNRLKHTFLQALRQHFAGELPDQRPVKKITRHHLVLPARRQARVYTQGAAAV